MDLSKAVWRKASKSTENGGNCVEVAGVSNAVVIRDSKNPGGPKLTMNHGEFHRFTETLKNLLTHPRTEPAS